jgi:hypothetical protein
MRTRMILPATLLLGAMPFAAEAHESTTVTAVVDKIVTQEQAEVQMLRRYSPLVETYIQTVKPDKDLGAVPDGDRYFLGRAELDKGVELEPLINDNGKHKLLLSVGRFFSSDFLPRGFLQMIYLDAEGFDRQHYKFTYAGQEFLGEVRCVIFDVDPLPGAGKGRFAGWKIRTTTSFASTAHLRALQPAAFILTLTAGVPTPRKMNGYRPLCIAKKATCSTASENIPLSRPSKPRRVSGAMS